MKRGSNLEVLKTFRFSSQSAKRFHTLSLEASPSPQWASSKRNHVHFADVGGTGWWKKCVRGKERGGGQEGRGVEWNHQEFY